MRSAAALLAVGLLGLILPVSLASASPTNRILNRKLPELKFSGISLGDAVDFLRDVSGANINVNWKALGENNVTQETVVNIQLRDVSLRKALTLLLSEAGGGDTLAFSVDEGVIEITTREIADRQLYTRVYDIQDLIMEIPDFTDAPAFDLNSTSNNGSSGSGSSGGSGGGSGGVTNNLFGNSNTNQQNQQDQGKTKTERAQDLIDLIQSTVMSDIWKDNGGTSSIRYYNGNLVITAPRSVHEAIGGDWD